MTDALTSTLSTYTIKHDGTVTPVAAQPDGGKAMCWVIQARGNFYVADNASHNLTGYHVDPEGKPTVFTQIPTREGPIDLAGTHDGRFLYAEVGIAGGVDGFPHRTRRHSHPDRHPRRHQRSAGHRRYLSDGLRRAHRW